MALGLRVSVCYDKVLNMYRDSLLTHNVANTHTHKHLYVHKSNCA